MHCVVSRVVCERDGAWIRPRRRGTTTFLLRTLDKSHRVIVSDLRKHGAVGTARQHETK